MRTSFTFQAVQLFKTWTLLQIWYNYYRAFKRALLINKQHIKVTKMMWTY